MALAAVLVLSPILPGVSVTRTPAVDGDRGVPRRLTDDHLHAALGQVPPSFIPNAGQSEPPVAFASPLVALGLSGPNTGTLAVFSKTPAPWRSTGGYFSPRNSVAGSFVTLLPGDAPDGWPNVSTVDPVTSAAASFFAVPGVPRHTRRELRAECWFPCERASRDVIRRRLARPRPRRLI